ncbi:MAG: NEW3 domain-containing protein, partial [Candidatus Thermoplasmatota archaeon]
NVNNPNQATYYLWDQDGSLRSSGGIDASCVSGVGECTTSARAVALSGDGSKFAVAGWPNSNGNSRVVFGTFQQGVLTSATLTGPEPVGNEVLDLDLDQTGSVVVVGSHILPVIPPTPPATDPGRVVLFRWSGSTVTQAWSTNTTEAASVVRVSSDGLRAAVAAGRPVRFDLSSSSGTAFTNAAVVGKALDVDIATGTPRWSIAGTDQGYFALFNSASDANPSFQSYQASKSASPVRAVAITQAGTLFAVGNDAGKLYLFTLTNGAATPVAQVAEAQPGPVRDLAFSADGKYMAAALPGSIALYDVSANRLTQLWNATLASHIGKVAIDSTGDTVVAATGSQAIVYSAIHRVTRTGPTTTQNLEPAVALPLSYVFENTGNRPETVSLSAQKPTGWTAQLSSDSLTLAPGGKATVTLTITAPDRTPPGDHFVQLTHNLASGGGDVLLPIPLEIIASQRWEMNATDGEARSIEAGGNATFPFTVTNLGNIAAVPAVTATIDEAGWSARISSTLVSIQPGEILPFDVVVTAPAGAAQLAAGTAHVRLAPDTIDLTATVGARFGVVLPPLQDLVVLLGGSETFTIAVRNSGNAPDGITLAPTALPTGWTLRFGLDKTATHHFDNVAAGTTATVQATLAMPATALSGVPVQLILKATSDSDGAQTASTSFRVTPQEPATSTSDSETDGGGSNGIPGPGLVLVLAAVAIAVLASRRRL